MTWDRPAEDVLTEAQNLALEQLARAYAEANKART